MSMAARELIEKINLFFPVKLREKYVAIVNQLGDELAHERYMHNLDSDAADKAIANLDVEIECLRTENEQLKKGVTAEEEMLNKIFGDQQGPNYEQLVKFNLGLWQEIERLKAERKTES